MAQDVAHQDHQPPRAELRGRAEATQEKLIIMIDNIKIIIKFIHSCCLEGVSGIGKYQGEYSYLRDCANDHSSRRTDKLNINSNNSFILPND